MLKRYQDILEDWQVDHLKKIGNVAGKSRSQMIRHCISQAIISGINIGDDSTESKRDFEARKKIEA